MEKRIWVISLAVVLVVAFAVVALAQNVVKGRVEALDKNRKKITIRGTEYALSDVAAMVKVKVGDEVEATVVRKVVGNLTNRGRITFRR